MGGMNMASESAEAEVTESSQKPDTPQEAGAATEAQSPSRQLYFWWAPTLGALAFQDNRTAFTDVKTIRSETIDLRLQQNGKSSKKSPLINVPFHALSNGIYFFEMDSAERGAAKGKAGNPQELANEASRLISERLGHLHIFHHKKPHDPSRVEKVARSAQAHFLLLCVSVVLMLFEVQFLSQNMDINVPYMNEVTGFAAATARFIPNWISAYLLLFSVFALAFKAIEKANGNVRFYFFRTLNLTTYVSFVIWIGMWLSVRFANLPAEIDNLLTHMKPRLLLGHDDNLSVYDIITIAPAAILLGLASRWFIKFFTGRALRISRNENSLSRLELAVSIPKEAVRNGVSAEQHYTTNARAVLTSIAKAQQNMIRSFVQYTALVEGQEDEARQRLSLFGRVLSFGGFGVLIWLIAAISIAELTDDPRPDRFGGGNVVGLMMMAIAASLGVWGILLQRIIADFSEPHLFRLQSFYGYFAYVDSFADLLKEHLPREDPLITSVSRSYCDTREIIKVKLDAARSRLEHGRAATTLFITLAGVLAGAFVAIFGSQLKAYVPGSAPPEARIATPSENANGPAN
jgi:hypothetical protein